ncbi:TolC family protein [bacterium]|nr:TolC family protein [bacterium]
MCCFSELVRITDTSVSDFRFWREPCKSPLKDRLRIFLLVVTLLLPLVSLQAATEPPSVDPAKIWTLPELVDLARQNNPDYRIAAWEQGLSRYLRLQAAGNFLPSLSSSASFSQSNSRRISWIGFEGEPVDIPEAITSISRSSRYSLSGSLSLFNGGRNLLEWMAADHNITATGLQLTSTDQWLVYQVTSASYQTMAAAEQLTGTRSFLEEQQDKFERTLELYRLGVNTHLDTLQSWIDLLNQRNALLEDENSLAMQQATLNELLGLPVDAKLQFAPPAQMINPELLQQEELLAQALELNPNLQLLRNDIELKRIRQWQATAAYLPTLDAEFSLSASADLGGDDRFFSTPENRNRYVGLRLSLPLFQGFNTTYALQASRLEHFRSRESYDKALREKETELQQILLELHKLYQQHDTNSQQLLLSRLTKEKTWELYRLQQVTLLEYRSAENQFLQSRFNELISRYYFLIQLALLEQAVGE